MGWALRTGGMMEMMLRTLARELLTERVPLDQATRMLEHAMIGQLIGEEVPLNEIAQRLQISRHVLLRKRRKLGLAH